jgi:phosphatidylinositol 4-phosphatase
MLSVLDDAYTVYGVKGVTAIPLNEDRAKTVVNTLASKNAGQPRPSLLPLLSTNTVQSDLDAYPAEEEQRKGEGDAQSSSQTAHVKFADEDQVKVMTPLNTTEFKQDSDEPPSPSSGASTPSSESSMTSGSVAQTLAKRLSFWNKLPKRPPQSPMEIVEEENVASHGADMEHYEGSNSPTPLKHDAKEVVDAAAGSAQQSPSEVLGEIIDSRAPPPKTQAEQHSELEDKVLKEIIREYTKGGMYFAYTFGQLISRAPLLVVVSIMSRYHAFDAAQTGGDCQV